MRGIGIDLVEISRVGKATERLGFLERIYTPCERELGESHRGRRQREFWAGRFAGKEAVAKALGYGFGGALSWQEIQICANSQGAPRVELLGAAEKIAATAGIRQVLVSITHTKDYAMAIAVALGGNCVETGNS